MSDILKTYDSWLTGSDLQALVIREHLVPVEGPDGVVFPATYAASKDGKFRGGYNIDKFSDTTNVCLIDSVGSQANRIEPIFADEKFKTLVPQIVVQAGEKSVNLLEAGHRAGDAIVRCSALQEPLRAAFQRILTTGDAEPLAKIAPTSLVFGVWDSRDTQAKLPRLLASTIRAFDVLELSRSAQYVPTVEFVESGLLAEPTDKKTKDEYAERGFVHVPATGTHGGIIAKGGIRRDATLSLAALRLLSAGSDAAKTLALRRYILGLALVAFTQPGTGYLRQGCMLVLDAEKPREFTEVYADGRRVPAALTADNALAFAKAAAAKFGVGENQAVEFDTDRAKADVSGDSADASKPAKQKKASKKNNSKSGSGDQ